MYIPEDYKFYLNIINPGELTDEDRRIIGDLINSDKGFKEKSEIYRKQILEFSAILRPEIIKLELQDYSSANESKYMKVAAMHNQIAEDKYVYKNTYISAQKLVLARVLYNDFRKTYRLFLTSDDMNNVKYAMVILKSQNKSIIATEEGVLSFLSENQIFESEIDIVLSSFGFQVRKDEIEKNKVLLFTDFEYNKNKIELIVERTDDKLKIKIFPTDKYEYMWIKTAIIVNIPSFDYQVTGLNPDLTAEFDLSYIKDKSFVIRLY